MDELDLMFLPPQLEVGAGRHTLTVHAVPHPDGVKVELRHPNVGSKAYRVMSEAVVADAQAVLDWIGLVAASVGMKLDAELRFNLKQAGYRT